MNKQKTIDKIRALKAKAASLLENRQGFADDSEFMANLKTEAQALLSFAASLQNKYSIADGELVSDSETANATLGGLQFTAAIQQNIRGIWFEYLCAAVGKIYTVRFAFLHKMKGNICLIVGDEDQTQLAATLLELLIEKAQLFFETLAESIDDLKKFEYLKGFAVGCNQTLKKENTADEEKPAVHGMLTGNHDEALAVRSQALACRTQALARIDAFIRENMGGQNMPPKLTPTSESFQQGLHDGLTHKQTRI